MFVLFTLLIITGGCGRAKDESAKSQPPAQPTGATTEQVTTATTKNETDIPASSADPRKGMATKISDFSYDLDGDGTDETVELHTQAERSSDGNIAWDDGQSWLLVVVNGDNYYPLLNQFVQLGRVYFSVWSNDNNKANITAAVITGSGVNLRNYTYNGDTNSFASQELFDIGGMNVLFSSMPDY